VQVLQAKNVMQVIQVMQALQVENVMQVVEVMKENNEKFSQKILF